MIPQLSVWADAESLLAFTYRSEHGDYFKRRSEWFVPLNDPPMPQSVAWYVKPGAFPTLDEGMKRLYWLRKVFFSLTHFPHMSDPIPPISHRYSFCL